jgi:hypothetical protein
VATLFLAWKAGLVRPDVHMAILFTSTATIPFLFPSQSPGLGPVRRLAPQLLGYACLVVSLFGLFTAGQRFDYRPSTFLVKAKTHIQRNAFLLGSLGQFRENLRAIHAEVREANQLPRIGNRVGNSPVDLFGHEQGVLLVNGLNWTPRPVFQSYLTYTRRLLKENADFFESPRAPRFLMIKLQTIDKRFPTMDDGLALTVILRRYRYLFTEDSYLLFERRRGETSRPRAYHPPAMEKTVQIGERVDIQDIPGIVQTLALDVDYTIPGRIRKMLFRAPSLWIKVETDTGESLKYRIIPSMTESQFIFNPFLKDRQTLNDWLSGATTPRIVAFRVVAEPGEEMYYRESLKVTLTADRASI